MLHCKNNIALRISYVALVKLKNILCFFGASKASFGLTSDRLTSTPLAKLLEVIDDKFQEGEEPRTQKQSQDHRQHKKELTNQILLLEI